MGDIQQILQTSWPYFVNGSNFYFYCGVHEGQQKSVLAC